MKSYSSLEQVYTKTLLKENINDIFEEFEEIPMSADMGLDDLITSIVKHIKTIPVEKQQQMRVAIKGMLLNKLSGWNSLEGYDNE